MGKDIVLVVIYLNIIENKVKGKVINSTPYEKKLVDILTEAQNRGEEISIEII